MKVAAPNSEKPWSRADRETHSLCIREGEVPGNGHRFTPHRTGGPGPPARRRFVVGLRPDACTVTDTSCRAAWRGERNEEQHSIARSNFQCAETDASRATAGGAAWSSGDANYWGLRRKCGDDDGRLRWAPRAAYLLVALAKVSPGQQSRFFFFYRKLSERSPTNKRVRRCYSFRVSA